MPRTRADFIQACESRLGDRENPKYQNKNNSQVNYDYGGAATTGPLWPWCAMDMWLCTRAAGFSVPKTASVWQFAQWAKNNEHGLSWVRNDQAVSGDMFAFYGSTHIGMVAWRSGAGFTSVEGNWDDECLRVYRSSWGAIEGCVRLPFEDSISAPLPLPPANGLSNTLRLGSVGPWVNVLQVRLNNIRALLIMSKQWAWEPLSVDGNFGPATLRALTAFQQKYHAEWESGHFGPFTGGKMNQVEAFCGIRY